jgi:hypothetical protein
MTPVERVRPLVQAGKVAPEEGERLIAALAQQPRRSPFWLLFNPFDRFGGGVAATLGILVCVLSLWTTRLGVHFDGFLDLHVSRRHVPTLAVSLWEQAAAWLLPALLFWGYAWIITRHARLVDFVGMVGLARVPLLLAAVPVAYLSPESPAIPPQLTPALLVIVLIVLPCVAWVFTLLYQGFKNASGLNGAKLVGGFIGIVVLAEVASKVALAFAR